jgi:hypothetical protein
MSCRPSNWAIEHRFTTVLNYTADFFGGYETRFSLFGQYNSGLPYSITLDGAGGYDRCLQLPAVPGLRAERAADRRQAQQRRGRLFGPRSTCASPRKLPGFMPEHRGSAFLMVDNLTNLLNDEWGVMRQPSFPYGVTAEQQANGQAQQRIGETSLWSMRIGVNYNF